MMNREKRLSPENLALKAVFRDLVEMAGGVSRAATLTLVNASRISNYCSPNDSAMPAADVVRDLERDVGEPVFTRSLADTAGFSLVPKCPADGSAAFTAHLGAVAKESGEAIASLAAAVQDGSVTPEEALTCLEEVGQAQERLACLSEDLKRLIASAPIKLRRA